MDRPPVVGKHPSGVAGVRVPGPEGPRRALLSHVVGELPDPAALDGVEPDVLGTELPHQDRRGATVGDVAEALRPSVGEDARHVRRREPRLGEHPRPVLVRRVHQPVGDVEPHRVGADAFQVAAPPVPVEGLPAGDLALDALNNYQPVRRLRKHGVASQLCGAPPVGGRPGSPSRRSVGLVLQVSADHVGLARVAGGERRPGGQPVGLGEAVLAVPEVVHEPVVCLRVVVEQDQQALAPRLVDDDVHHLLRRVAREGGVPSPAVVDARRRGCPHGRQRERHPDCVETLGLDLGQHVLVVAGPETVRSMILGLEAEPVDALQHDCLAGGVDNAVAVGGERHRDRADGGRAGGRRWRRRRSGRGSGRWRRGRRWRRRRGLCGRGGRRWTCPLPGQCHCGCSGRPAGPVQTEARVRIGSPGRNARPARQRERHPRTADGRRRVPGIAQGRSGRQRERQRRRGHGCPSGVSDGHGPAPAGGPGRTLLHHRGHRIRSGCGSCRRCEQTCANGKRPPDRDRDGTPPRRHAS